MILPEIDVNMADGKEAALAQADIDVQGLLSDAIRTAVSIGQLEMKQGSELSLVLCGDETIRSLNAEWRDKDKATNVLSFPNQPGGPLLGDIVISVDTLFHEAELENKAVKDHLCHLIVHGFLHLFGYDHMNDAEALSMEGLETEILKNLGVADPYGNEIAS